MRIVTIVVLALLAPVSVGLAAELRIAAWNLEHLDDAEGAGCVGRSGVAYDELARRVAGLDADIVAFQEVESVAAARRVFPEPEWQVEMSSRPAMRTSQPCWDRPEAMLGHLGTGFAIRPAASPTGDMTISKRWDTGTRSSVGEPKLP